MSVFAEHTIDTCSQVVCYFTLIIVKSFQFLELIIFFNNIGQSKGRTKFATVTLLCS